MTCIGRTLAFAALVATSGCSSGRTLLVNLKTDMVSGLEFDQVQVQLLSLHGAQEDAPSALRDASVSASRGRNFFDGARVAEWSGLEPTNYVVRLRVLRAGRRLQHRDVIVTLRGSMAVTVLLTRDCVGIVCPAPGGDPVAQACLAGQCVDERCTELQPEFCPEPECASDTDCAAQSTVACAQGECSGGVCLVRARDELCAAIEWCDPDQGCAIVPVDVDAGDADGGVDADDVGADAEGNLDADADDGCVPSAEVCNGADDDCDGIADNGLIGCVVAGTWVATNSAAASAVPVARVYSVAVWTGSEMIVWGGVGTNRWIAFATGGRYNPATDSWTVVSTTNAPTARYTHTAVWTGTEMIVWGGGDDFSSFLKTGGRYTP